MLKITLTCVAAAAGLCAYSVRASDYSAVLFFAGSGISAPARFNIGSSRSGSRGRSRGWSQIGVADVLEADGQTLGHAVKDIDVGHGAVGRRNHVAIGGHAAVGRTDDVAARQVARPPDRRAHHVLPCEPQVRAVHHVIEVEVSALARIAGR